jgi:hypothetical protein
VEGNCHFLEFPAPKTHSVRRAAEFVNPADEPAQASELSATAKSDSAHAAATLTRDAAHRNRLGNAGRCAISARRQARSRRALRYPAGRQAIERQVRLYCFRLGKCGTFMPLFCVRGISKIAVVWNFFAAVFSAVAPVPLRVVSTHAAVLSAVDQR